MVDTHCHIFSDYYDDISEIINKAYSSGVKMLIINGYNMKSNMEVVFLVKKYDIVYGAIGLQPSELDDYPNYSVYLI